MTKKLFFLQFFLIILIFVLPPIFARLDADAEIFLGKFNFFSLLNFSLAVFLFLQNKGEAEEPAKKIPLYLKIGILYSLFFVTFGALLVSGVVFESIGALLGLKGGAKITMPQLWYEYLFCLLNFLFQAFYEESLYRLYLPDALGKIIPGLKTIPDSAEKQRAAEIACVLLFALAHSYSGIPAVLNAAAAGIILRRTALKAKSIMPGFFAHLAYNLVSAAVLAAAFSH